MKLLFISLGCDKNRVDSEQMLNLLTTRGIELTDWEDEADIIIINTCCFIGDAKEESINTILEMAEYRTNGSCRALIVTGCLAQRYQDEIHQEIPEVDAIIGTNSIDSICEAVDYVINSMPKADDETSNENGNPNGASMDNRKSGDKNTDDAKNPYNSSSSGIFAKSYYKKIEPLTGLPQASKQLLTTPGHYAYLKIAEGCDKNCTYCVIPSVRGHYRSVPMEELIRRAQDLVSSGVKEIILVAQETTLYGVDLYGEKSLHRLLDELNQIPGLLWIRILYCYPEEIYDGLLDAMIRNEKVCHYLDIPIQHCNDTILRRMGRRTNRKELEERIARIRERIPDITLRTTLICGFPGETQEMHEELMQFVNDMEFDRLGAFAYSREEGTPAADFEGQISEEQKAEWVSEIMELQEEVSHDCNDELIGRELTVLIEGRVTDDLEEEEPAIHTEFGKAAYAGRSYRDAPDVDGYVFVSSDEELMTGDVCKVRVKAALDYDLMGEIV